MKIQKKKFGLGFFFSNWEKSHINPIGKEAEFRPLRTPKKIKKIPDIFTVSGTSSALSNISLFSLSMFQICRDM